LSEVTIPGRGEYRFEHLVLDLNGTIALDGNIIEGVSDKLEFLSNMIDVLVVTADTRGKAQELGQSLRVRIHKVEPGDEQAQKLKLVQELGKDTTVSIGNSQQYVFVLCIIGRFRKLLVNKVLRYFTLLRGPHLFDYLCAIHCLSSCYSLELDSSWVNSSSISWLLVCHVSTPASAKAYPGPLPDNFSLVMITSGL
jgi:soluble P-type ATPase